MAELIFHRGSHQIGGMCAEIRTKETRLIIDFGASLPCGDKKKTAESDNALVAKVFGENPCADAVLFTHYHNDHIGLMSRIPENIPQYIGPVAVQLARNLSLRTDYVSGENRTAILDRMKTYEAGKPIFFKDIKVTPFQIGHSALDSYMFLIETEGKRILYTGDFRDHGIVCSKETFKKLLKYYVRKIDILITEGTMFTRSDKTVMNEYELCDEARAIFRKKEFNFVLVSSTNLDSIMSFLRATPIDKEFICDKYQLAQILTASNNFGTKKGGRYKFYNITRRIKTIEELKSGDDINALKKKGFVMLVRATDKFKKYLKMFDKNEVNFVYSMWDGYLDKNKPYTNQTIIDFVDGYNIIKRHTSGHASVKCIKNLIEITNPSVIIPMHTDCPEGMKNITEFQEYKDKICVRQDDTIFNI